MKISGHRTAGVFRRYDITTEGDIRNVRRPSTARLASLRLRKGIDPEAELAPFT
jgi:hypothetical protein